jgi:hypothetical protein
VHDSRYQLRREIRTQVPLDGNMVVVDPFGPHPVLITGSHDFSLKSSLNEDSDLFIVENAGALAMECAVHIIGLYDHYRWRSYIQQMGEHKGTVGLQPDDQWQQHYFEKVKRSEFNFLFGSLWPGLD